jgi:probable rRNA maturation factor
LLGYDHIDDGDAAIMEKLEIEALARLGMGNPYEENANNL